MSCLGTVTRWLIHSQWRTSIVTVEWPDECNEEPERIAFYWREPMDFIEQLVTDESLMQHSHFYATRKHIIRGDREYRMLDEPWTGNTWYHIEVCVSPFARFGLPADSISLGPALA
jgi:hypothetical protein